jgi:adenylate cyclase
MLQQIRLRARLETYYHAEGSRDALIIELPKGGYRPVFRERATVADTATPTLLQETLARAGWTWSIAGALAALLVIAIATTWWWTRRSHESVTVAVLPLQNVGADPRNDYFADGLTDEIIRNLSIIEGLTVARPCDCDWRLWAVAGRVRVWRALESCVRSTATPRSDRE